MATTIAQIAQYLDRLNWKYEVDRENSRIVTAVRAERVEQFVIEIRLHEEGQFLQLYTPKLLHIYEHQHRELIFRTLLSLSWRNKIVQWEYDLIDGEVQEAIDLPLEDAPLTEKQFYRCLSSLVQLVDQVAMPRIQAVMTTGTDPVEQEIGERLLLMLQESAPKGFLQVLESAVARSQNRS